MSELAKTYEPSAVEAKWYAYWLEQGCFQADPARVSAQRPAYSIVIPPPNVTGVLTLGHVLNNTIQDILARRARMLGKEVLWLPGTDHAGIATQNVVEKSLRKAGEMKHRDDLGREALVAKIWEWKEKYGGIIIQQLKKLGASCDWSRERFTMDAEYSKCVSRVFVDLYKKGLIYRGKRMVNWCPASLTALSDEEVVMKPQSGVLYYFKVEVVDTVAAVYDRRTSASEGDPEPQEEQSAVTDRRYSEIKPTGTWLTIATTRPETIPGDTAVAVNPKDTRYAHLIGQHVRRPLPVQIPDEQKLIPIIGDEHVDFEFGTGVLKVTPAHDKADFEIGQRHKLAVVDIMNPDGTMNALAGESLAGLDRFEARNVAVERLRELCALEKEEPYQNNVGYSERADVPIEPRLSEQWFLKYPSVEQARACVSGRVGVPPADSGILPESFAVDGALNVYSDESGETPDSAGGTPTLPGKMRFFPERWAKVYDHWLEGIQDWCISRQLWWGHRIPVWRKRFQLTEKNWTDELLPWGWDDFVEGNWDAVAAMGVTKGSGGEPFDFKTDRLMPVVGETEDQYEIVICTYDEKVGHTLEDHGFTQDPDVLDTWFSSWLWPFATMGWPEKTETLAKFYPTTDLVTGPDIIFFWVARMIMAGFEWMGELPFRNVYFTGIIRDKQGRKMSKSLGNSPDPLDLIAKYGADALRFGVMRSAPLGSDILFDEKNVELGRNFCTKLWNATRFRQMQGGLPNRPIDPTQLEKIDCAILAHLHITIAHVSDALGAKVDWHEKEGTAVIREVVLREKLEFTRAVGTLDRFFWREFCDWYLEASKVALASDDQLKRENVLAVVDKVLSTTLLLLHPFLPFITEELWHGLDYNQPYQRDRGGATIMFAPWPVPFDSNQLASFGLHFDGLTFKEIDDANTFYATVNVGRKLRSDSNVPPHKRARFVLWHRKELLAPHDVHVLKILLTADAIEQTADDPRMPGGVMTSLGTLYLSLEGLIDVAAERERLAKEIARVEQELAKVRAKLADSNFTAKVPAKVLDEHRQREQDWAEKHAQLVKMREALGTA